MKAGTSINFRPDNKGIERHAKIEDTILVDGNTKYLIVENKTGEVLIIKPEEITVIEHDLQK